MRLLDLITTSSESLRRNKSRSLLTILGVVIGIAAVILMLAIGQSAEGYILNQVADLGSDLVFVEPSSGNSAESGPPSPYIEQTLTLDDVEALGKSGYFMAVSPVLATSTAVSRGEEGKQRKNRPINLRDFMKRPSIIIEDTEINREEIIKYISNKLGGAHYDINRKSGNTLEEKYKLLDRYKSTNELAGKNAIYFELLSIGQKLVNNKDVQKLKKKIKNYLKEE